MAPAKPNSSNSNSGKILLPGLIVALALTSLASFYSSRRYWSFASTTLLLQHNPVRQALLGFESSYAPDQYSDNVEGRGSSSSTTSASSSSSGNQIRAIQRESGGVGKNEQSQPIDLAQLQRQQQSSLLSSSTTSTSSSFVSETKAELIARLYPNETAIPNPPRVADGRTTFAACLLVMDDNHRLTEWLTYHYHVLPLRYIVMAIDERSRTTPTHLLNAWRRRNVTIIEWTDADFWRRKDGTLLQQLPDDAAFQQKRDRHRGRQKYFYKQCLIHLKAVNRTWVSLHDSDEYLLYNPQHQHAKQRPQQPSTAEPGGMIRYIEQERAAGIKYYQSPCIGIPRLIFGADPQRFDEKRVVHNVPPALLSTTPALTENDQATTSSEETNLALSMDTLVYRHHAKRDDFIKNALGKVIIDVSRVDVVRTPYFMSLHRPIKTICPAPWHKDAESGLRINHYLGSWESYSFRDDARRGGERSWEQWEYKATTVSDSDADSDDTIRPWVQGLVDAHGADEARSMLQHVGLPPSYRNADSPSWHLLPEKLAAILSVPESTTQDNKAVAFEDWVREKYKKPKQSPSLS
jgi:hypothetical protein